MSFPLNLGTVLPLDSVIERGDEARSTGALLPGTLLYSLVRSTRGASTEDGDAGGIYMLIASYDGSAAPECAQLLRKRRGSTDYYCD